jgi:hypothetical protein
MLFPMISSTGFPIPSAKAGLTYLYWPSGVNEKIGSDASSVLLPSVPPPGHTPHNFWHCHLKPGSIARLTSLFDRDARD